jgi:hypothetical protein
MFFDGTGDYLIFSNNNQNLTLGSGDFTIELWFYQTATTFFGTIFSTTFTWTTSSQLRISTGNNNNTLRVASGSSDLFDSNTTFNNNVWNHIALTRSGTTLRLFLNGTQVGSATNSTNFVTDTFMIGQTSASGTNYYFQGYMDDFRITKGYARYTANFTPPTSAFKTK